MRVHLAFSWFTLLATAAVAQGPLARGPAVCCLQPAAAVIQWRTGQPTVGAVAWGPTPGLGQLTAAAPASQLHEVPLAGLQPCTHYWYQVLDGSTPISPVFEFRTPPTAAHPFARIAVFGDSGVASAGQFAVARLAAELAPDLVLMPGDINYPLGDAATIDQNYFLPYAALLPRIPFYLTPGNHDCYTGCGQPYYDAFCLPTSQRGGEHWYSFDVGNVHIVSANTEVIPVISACGSVPEILAQVAWLDADLAASTATWKIVFLHRPPRSDSLHGPEPLVQFAFEPILEARGVDLLIAGHDHCYQRFPRLVGGVPDARGPRHLVVGTGGAASYAIAPGPLLESGASTFGLALLDVSGNQLRIRFVDAGASYGTVLDDVTMQKGVWTPSLTASASAIQPGDIVDLGVLGEAGQPWILFGALQPAMAPLPPHGLWLLDPRACILGMGITDVGPDGISLTAPTSPALTGLRVHCQAGAGSTDPAVFGVRLTNAVGFIVR